ncbi:hypothetical protein MAPG_08615 [Magnaporthiopsis poae ATCC 64411]|uniref:Uncharacterized protein n=1 Tax=Magnaporthiopsis poae (strain ATCC 64411 / 73-15) TaxID=644358 RepID=A0A0C4E7U2_MAGP6|nr:hypothetical protein MAPG_08615 [Magnaporthiopsis poae ATCC 64411]
MSLVLLDRDASIVCLRTSPAYRRWRALQVKKQTELDSHTLIRGFDERRSRLDLAGERETSDHGFVEKLFDKLRNEKRIPDHESIVDSLEARLSRVLWVDHEGKVLPDKRVVQPLETDLYRANNQTSINDIDTYTEYITLIPRQATHASQSAQRQSASSSTLLPRPADQSGSSLALCVLPLEADAVELLFDELYTATGKADSDDGPCLQHQLRAPAPAQWQQPVRCPRRRAQELLRRSTQKDVPRAQLRDEFARKHKVVAFEMEGAGV